MSKYQAICPDLATANNIKDKLIKQGAKVEMRESVLVHIYRQEVVPESADLRVEPSPTLTEYTHQLEKKLDEDEIAEEVSHHWVVEADQVLEVKK